MDGHARDSCFGREAVLCIIIHHLICVCTGVQKKMMLPTSTTKISDIDGGIENVCLICCPFHAGGRKYKYVPSGHDVYCGRRDYRSGEGRLLPWKRQGCGC